jgi:hypothetical protein
MSDKAMVPVLDEEWGQIVDRLVETINQDEEIPENVVEATELLLVGFPIHHVANEVGVQPATVRRWITKYPVMAATLAQGRSMLTKWRMGRLEQQFLKAVNRSDQILDLSMSGAYWDDEGNQHFVDPKVLSVVAAQSRYVIGLFSGQKLDVKVTHELGDTVFKAQENALDYIADKLQQQNDGQIIDAVETTYRVIDEKVEDGPILSDDGSPLYGEMGKLDTSADGTLCHICGNRYKSLHAHLYSKHNMSTKDYEVVYLLEQGAVRAAKIEENDNGNVVEKSTTI